MIDDLEDELDRWMPDAAIRVAHRRASSASSEALWDAARALTLEQSPVLGRLIQWRIPGTTRTLTFDRLLREPPFLVLAEGERTIVSGLVGRIWTLRRDYPELADPEEFRDWSERGTSRVVIAISAEPEGEGGVLSAEARVQALGTQGQLGVAAVRPLVRGFQHLIGTEALRAAVRRAEQSPR